MALVCPECGPNYILGDYSTGNNGLMCGSVCRIFGPQGYYESLIHDWGEGEGGMAQFDQWDREIDQRALQRGRLQHPFDMRMPRSGRCHPRLPKVEGVAE